MHSGGGEGWDDVALFDGEARAGDGVDDGPEEASALDDRTENIFASVTADEHRDPQTYVLACLRRTLLTLRKELDSAHQEYIEHSKSGHCQSAASFIEAVRTLCPLRKEDNVAIETIEGAERNLLDVIALVHAYRRYITGVNSHFLGLINTACKHVQASLDGKNLFDVLAEVSKSDAFTQTLLQTANAVSIIRRHIPFKRITAMRHINVGKIDTSTDLYAEMLKLFLQVKKNFADNSLPPASHAESPSLLKRISLLAQRQVELVRMKVDFIEATPSRCQFVPDDQRMTAQQTDAMLAALRMFLGHAEHLDSTPVHTSEPG